MKKKDVPPHIVIPDTSVLWHRDKTHIVDPAFDEFWKANSKEFHLELVVPEVVKGELLFQQTTSAVKSTEDISKLMAKVSAISAHRYSHRIKKDDLKDRVKARFDKWVASCHGSIEPVPVRRIEWPRLIHDAIWRVPPFAEDKSDKAFEKGFRDALILETLVEYCKHHTKSDISIAFICGDGLLCKASNTRLETDIRFAIYDTCEEFESYLSLTRKELTNQFIRNIIKRASAKFFTKGDDSCLALRADVASLIRKDFQQYFEDPTSARTDTFEIISSIGLGSEKKWESVNKGMFWVGNTVFDRIENENIYYWKTTVSFAQLFQRSEVDYSGGLLAGLAEVTKQRLLVLPVMTTWYARVTSDARFHDIEMDGLSMGEKDFREPTDDDAKSFNLPRIASNKAMDSNEE